MDFDKVFPDVELEWQKRHELHTYGCAEGNYVILCIDCNEYEIGADKRAIRCKSCATKLKLSKEE